MTNRDTKRILNKIERINSVLDVEEFMCLEKEDKRHVTASIEFEQENNKLNIEKALDELLRIVMEVLQ